MKTVTMRVNVSQITCLRHARTKNFPMTLLIVRIELHIEHHVFACKLNARAVSIYTGFN